MPATRTVDRAPRTSAVRRGRGEQFNSCATELAATRAPPARRTNPRKHASSGAKPPPDAGSGPTRAGLAGPKTGFQGPKRASRTRNGFPGPVRDGVFETACGHAFGRDRPAGSNPSETTATGFRDVGGASSARYDRVRCGRALRPGGSHRFRWSRGASSARSASISMVTGRLERPSAIDFDGVMALRAGCDHRFRCARAPRPPLRHRFR